MAAESNRTPHTEIDSHFARNTTGVSLVEILWGLGLPIIMESTYLQLYLRSLGASSFLIGLVPAILYTGLSLNGLLAGYLTGHLPRKRNAVVLTHIGGSLPFPILGLILLLFGFNSSTIPVFFIAYGIFSMFMGLMAPIWQNYIVIIFSERKVVQGHSILWMAQSGAKIISSFIIFKWIEAAGITAASSSAVFLLVGTVALAGSFMFLLTREVPAADTPAIVREKKFSRHLFTSSKEIFKNRNFINFMLSDFETFAILGVISFYANYAVDYCGITASLAAGVFIGLYYIGGFAANILFGTLNFLSLRNKLFYTKFISLAGILVIIFFSSMTAFLLSSFLLGFSRSNRNLVYSLSVKKLSRSADATNYFALAYIIQLPASVGIPLINGKVLDILMPMGPLSYTIIFTGMAALVLVSLFFFLKVDFTKS
jgi:MFS family permease